MSPHRARSGSGPAGGRSACGRAGVIRPRAPARRVRRPTGRGLREWGRGLPARTASPARGRRRRWPGSLSPVWLAVAAAVAVSVTGLVGLGLAVVVVSDPRPVRWARTVGGSAALAGRLWLLAQGGETRRRIRPDRARPAAADPRHRVGAVAGRPRAGAAAGTTTLRARRPRRRDDRRRARRCSPWCWRSSSTGREPGSGCSGRSPVPPSWRLAAVGLGQRRGSPGCSTRRWTGLPGAPRPLLRGVLAGLLTAARPVHRRASPSRWPSDAAGYAALSGSLGGAGGRRARAARPGVAAAAERGGGRARARRRARASPSAAGTLVSVHGVTLGSVPALPAAGRAARHPGGAADRLRLPGGAGGGRAGRGPRRVGRWFGDATADRWSPG